MQILENIKTSLSNGENGTLVEKSC